MKGLWCLLLVLVGAYLTPASPLTGRSRRGDKSCHCDAGQLLLKRGCLPCPPGTFSSGPNCDPSCPRCFGDCKPELHLKVIRNCSSTSDLQCECEQGFVCDDRDSDSGNCRSCQRLQKNTTTGSPLRQSSTRKKSCSFPACSPVPSERNATEPRKDSPQSLLVSVVCPLVAIGGLALFLLICFGCPGHETRFKQILTFPAVKQLCAVETNDSNPLTGDLSVQKQHMAPVASANMGPVHVHNPGTVIFSLLGEFSGQIGQTKEERAEAKEPKEEDSYCTVCQPTLTPTFPPSEEEHPGDQVFFPSQEQGKDCCVSMEEQL